MPCGDKKYKLVINAQTDVSIDVTPMTSH